VFVFVFVGSFGCCVLDVYPISSCCARWVVVLVCGVSLLVLCWSSFLVGFVRRSRSSFLVGFWFVVCFSGFFGAGFWFYFF